MSQTFAQLVTVLEYAVALGGLGFLGWFRFSSAGRALRARPAAMAAWQITAADFLFLIWLVLALGLLGQILLRMLIGQRLHGLPEGGTLELVLAGSMFHLGAILAWIGARVLARRRPPLLTAAPVPRFSWLQSASGGALTFLAAMPLLFGTGWVWESLLQWVGLPTEHQELVDMFTRTRSPLLLTSLVVLALVVAPVSEELVFRGGLFRYLRTRTRPWVAFGASAALFALLHSNWISFLPLFVLGIVFAAGYQRTGSIAVPMIAHALFNLNTLLLVLSGAAQ
jgi:membrane protease YdiL (CAAX protease family)